MQKECGLSSLKMSCQILNRKVVTLSSILGTLETFMRKLTPWTILRRKLEPVAEDLHDATPWRVKPPMTVENWLCSLCWFDLLICNQAVQGLLRHDPPQLANCWSLIPLTVAVDAPEDE